MAEKSARILLVCKRFFLTKMRPYLAANAITIANSGFKFKNLSRRVLRALRFSLEDYGLRRELLTYQCGYFKYGKEKSQDDSADKYTQNGNH